jgi:hypothetical protein
MSYFQCIKYNYQQSTPIHFPCPSCNFDIEHLDGKNLSQWQQRKWFEHTELLHGSNVNLHGKDWNCSFDIVGYTNIHDIVIYTINYGHKTILPNQSGKIQNVVIFSFIPEIIGAGLSPYCTSGAQPCSGCCIISPQSINYGHPFPILYDWVTNNFSAESTFCKICGIPTSLGITVCSNCYAENLHDWTNLL